MTITPNTFRNLETMLTAAALPSVDVLMSIIGLATDAISPMPLPDDAREPDPIVLRLSMLADRLGWEHPEAPRLLMQANEETLATLGFTLCNLDTDWMVQDDGQLLHVPQPVPTEVTVSGKLTTIIYGNALLPIERGDGRAMEVDAGSSAMLALISRIAAVGGAILYREPETADERVAELWAVAATIAALPLLHGKIAMHDNSDAGCVRSSATACQRRSDSRPVGRSKSRPLLTRA